MDGQADRRADGSSVRQTNRRADKRTHEWTDGQANGEYLDLGLQGSLRLLLAAELVVAFLDLRHELVLLVSHQAVVGQQRLLLLIQLGLLLLHVLLRALTARLLLVVVFNLSIATTSRQTTE